MTSRLLPCGEDGVLVEVAGLAAVRALDAALRAAPVRDVVDVVPAARTVLVRGAARSRRTWAAAVARVAADAAARWDDAGAEGAGAAAGSGLAAAGGRVVEVPVVYDGADLHDVADETGLSAEEVVGRHLVGGPDGYRVAFGGFAPGFAYVVGLDPRLHVPRLASPRTRVPTGAVAVAGEFTAVYPAASPGGWRLLGTTDVAMFDVARGREGAALLGPGDVVRFVRRSAPAVAAAAGARAAAAPEPVTAGPDARAAGAPTPRAVPAARTLTVVATGPLTLVEDAGRPGLAAVGVPRSGAADPDALRRANRLVGNRADAAGLEVLLGGLVLRCDTTTAVAVTGARVAALIDGVLVPHATAVRAPAGSTLRLAAPRDGLRTWLAVRGGIDVPPVLGSRSADVLSGLGPAAVRPGDLLPLGAALDGLPEPALPGAAAGDGQDAADVDGPAAVVLLDASDGPRLDHLDGRSGADLWSTVWEVAAASNRVAVRLTGAPLTRATLGELASEGLVAGAVQVPHDGRPVLFGPDHPVTGGYPVVAVLTRAAQARAAQLRPGQQVRLRRVAPVES
ncbi:5-oxoprolinase/urea amidolyase family protein [Cellulomonas xiejunii]|uniref:5-oxoprolinase/urea amidolyase family protein n=1 Tax=Cellulomonas xiejunii TaxID=2968083 RepID=A0ABY5KP14_9CELL|nr:5-oxoprolinase/urea amidolyase family protein [Cellulomonas xiejunii]MCC2320607.1 5-oxoprolinase/urea amidolyase family protein [Cellulomonas xiejunii]UUI70897.1 5-oxoprolinase/urea amidolyase family protein [Cellulomonas xiejunii]